MNTKRFVIGSIVVFVCFQVLDFIFYGIILKGSLEAVPYLWRPDMAQKMWIMYLTGLAVSFLFVYIFIKGYENKGLMEGLKYGIIVGLFMSIPACLSSYALYPMPFSLAAKWFIVMMIEVVIGGLITAAVYKPKAA